MNDPPQETQAEWRADLIAQCPHTLGHREGVGFECGDGWRQLLTDLFTTIEAIVAALPETERPHVVQIKEKFGTLRVYMNRAHPAIESEIALAETRSITTCEVCGEPGRLGRSSTGWMRVRCAEHG